MSRLTAAALLGLLAVASADITVSRTISNVASGFTGKATVDKDCTGTDAYGSNNCDFHWGDSVTLSLSGNLAKPLAAGSKIAIDAKLDGFIPFKASCNMCGAPCQIKIPVVKKTVTINVPPCPIPAGPLTYTTKLTLPSKSPVPVTTKAKATVTLTDASGAIVARADVTGEVNSSTEDMSEEEKAEQAAQWAEIEDFVVDLQNLQSAPLGALRGSAMSRLMMPGIVLPAVAMHAADGADAPVVLTM